MTGNEDSRSLPWFAYAATGRGTASGGGLYPVEIYWAAGPNGPLPAGLYHYASQHHAMERLLAGDPTAQVRAALGPDAAGDTDQFLLLSVKLWKNAFKYNSFSYHVVTTDIGTLVGTWNVWARSRGLSLTSTCGSPSRGSTNCSAYAPRRRVSSPSSRCGGAAPRRGTGPTATSRSRWGRRRSPRPNASVHAAW